MVVGFGNAAPDYKAEALNLARSFEEACDQDASKTRGVVNGSIPVESLRFYAVPLSFLQKAWHVLRVKTEIGIEENWRDEVGKIQNAVIVEGTANDATPTDMELEDGNQVSSESGSVPILRRDMLHARDYFFLGEQTWKLVKREFGYDGIEIERGCEKKSDMGAISVYVCLLAEEPLLSFVIPDSGNFEYDSIFQSYVPHKRPSDNGTDTDLGMINDATNEFHREEEASSAVESAGATLSTTSDSSPTKVERQPLTDDISNGTATSTPPGFFRRKEHASGLGNLGNTCFMASSIQCLAHTEPLRQYFISGEYRKDLNRDNPLGTGGDLATQFAKLLCDMWGDRPTHGGGYGKYNYSNSGYMSAVYPREFKLTLGRHAEQFVGYDQHDSQELATYLLDALHEDTNRVTKKPYVEKHEQGENEPDNVAAATAWDLHLQREDSRVLENFMGQVKSRVECCKEGCDRSSTTFDPFMYLSVPIPGASKRAIGLTFIPLDPSLSAVNIEFTIDKTATLETLLKKMNEHLVERGVISQPIPLEDLYATDVWNHEIYSVLKTSIELEEIKERDITFVYQLQPLSEIRRLSENEDFGDIDTSSWDMESELRHPRPRLDLPTMTRLKRDDEWEREFEKYFHSTHLASKLLKSKVVSVEERQNSYKRLVRFVEACYGDVLEEESAALKRPIDEAESDEVDMDTQDSSAVPNDDDTPIPSVIERCEQSTIFKDVKSKHDVAILDFCARQFRRLVIESIESNRMNNRDGIVVHVVMKRSFKREAFTNPLVVRIAPNETVFGFREHISKRIARALVSDSEPEPTDENDEVMQGNTSQESRNMDILRQIPLTFERKAAYSSNYRSSGGFSKQLGMLEAGTQWSVKKEESTTIADPSDNLECENICNIVNQGGTLFLNWPDSLVEKAFDTQEYERSDDMPANGSEPQPGKKDISVTDCIKQFCKLEQLEETEMWYCNRCKEHVKAWKQFNIYRAPPILIIHLKRFHYSARTHRRDKIGSFIDFPLEDFDLSELVSEWTEEERPIYDCYAVSNHYGGLGGGHYTAYTLDDDGKWSHYDDSRVTTDIGTDQVRSNAAYVLYYRRKDVVVGKDTLIACETTDEDTLPSTPISNAIVVRMDDDADQSLDSPVATSPAGSVASSLENDVMQDSSFVHEDDDYDGVRTSNRNDIDDEEYYPRQ